MEEHVEKSSKKVEISSNKNNFFSGYETGSCLKWYGRSLRENAKLFSDFCSFTYTEKENINNKNYYIRDWERLESKNVELDILENKDTFRCHVFKQNEKSGGMLVFAFKGTNIFNLEDISNICTIISGEPPLFLSKIHQFIESEIKKHKLEKSKIYLCGHSLGGYIANMLAIIHGYNSVTFDSPGISIQHISISNLSYHKKNFKHISFLSHPNIINCFGEQFFDVYYIARNVNLTKEEAKKNNLLVKSITNGTLLLASGLFPTVNTALNISNISGISEVANKSFDEFGFLGHIHSVGFFKSCLEKEEKIIKINSKKWFSIGSSINEIDVRELSKFAVFADKAEKIQNESDHTLYKIYNELEVFTDGHTFLTGVSLLMGAGLIYLIGSYMFGKSDSQSITINVPMKF